MVALFGVMWLFMIRPQKRKQLERQQMLRNVGPGAEILTAGGIYGTVVDGDDDSVTLEIAEDVEVRVARNAVAMVVPPAEEVDDEDVAVAEEEELEDLHERAELRAEAESANPERR